MKLPLSNGKGKLNSAFAKRTATVIFAGLLTAFSVTGCTVAEKKIVLTTGFSENEVFRIEDSVCSLQEALVYLVNTQVGYENTFGSDIWGAETDDGTIEDRLKDSVLAKVAQIKAMNLLALEEGIELDEEEIAKAEEAAAEYYETLTEADIKAMKGITKQELTEIIMEQATADKLYQYIIRDINPEISDDEARTITVEQILIKTYSQDNIGNRTPYTDTEKDEAYMKIREIYKKILNGASFEELMSQYNEADESTISFGKGEKEPDFETAAFNLGTEETSGIIESDEGYVILKCISTFNREETEANKNKIVAQRKREVFGAQYDAFVADLTKELNEKLWDSIELIDDDNVSASNLMEVYEKYFK
jgi:foldase protein PrsA